MKHNYVFKIQVLKIETVHMFFSELIVDVECSLSTAIVLKMV